MEFTLRYGVSYKNVLTKLSLYSALSIFGCILLGYIFLPFAAAYYGALLTFENRGKRVMTYVLPAIFFTLNLIIRAAFSLEAVCYVILGAILYFAARKNWSKSETAVWMIAVTLILLSLSAVFIAFEKTGSIGFMPLKQFYSNIYINLKDGIIKYLTTLTSVTADGNTIFLFDLFDAECIFNELLLSIVPFAFLISFAIVGFAFKIFEGVVSKNSTEVPEFSKWRFGASNLVCYFYILLAVLSIIATNDGSIFIFTLISLNTIFSVIFAYLGFRFIYNIFISKGKSGFFTVSLFVIAFIMFSSSIITISSYIGVIVTLIFNRSSAVSK